MQFWDKIGHHLGMSQRHSTTYTVVRVIHCTVGYATQWPGYQNCLQAFATEYIQSSKGLKLFLLDTGKMQIYKIIEMLNVR